MKLYRRDAKEPSKPLQDGQKVNTAIDIRS